MNRYDFDDLYAAARGRVLQMARTATPEQVDRVVDSIPPPYWSEENGMLGWILSTIVSDYGEFAYDPTYAKIHAAVLYESSMNFTFEWMERSAS